MICGASGVQSLTGCCFMLSLMGWCGMQANTLAFCLYNMARSPACQERLAAEAAAYSGAAVLPMCASSCTHLCITHLGTTSSQCHRQRLAD